MKIIKLLFSILVLKLFLNQKSTISSRTKDAVSLTIFSLIEVYFSVYYYFSEVISLDKD